MADEQTIGVYDTSVDSYFDVIDSDTPEQPLLDFVKHLSKGSLVLDFGCGPGKQAAEMRKLGIKIDAVDASSEMVHAANQKFDLDARIATFDELIDTEKYDGVWANFSLLHDTPEKFPNHLRAIHRALKPSGVFHIGLKLGDGTMRDKLGRYYSYYSEETLTTHLRDTGFAIKTITTGEGVGLAGDISPWITIISQK